MLLLTFVPIITITILFAIFLFYGKEGTLNLVITDIDFLKIPDGTYLGSYRKGRFSYKVEVTIKSSKVANINIINESKISLASVPKKIIESVLKEQSLKIDMVTGATVTSKAVLKAIENALSK
ncbi:MAG: FMN-binding protein [bacterium]